MTYCFLLGEAAVICELNRDDFDCNLTKHVGILVAARIWSREPL
jgi:hypothetical protein